MMLTRREFLKFFSGNLAAGFLLSKNSLWSKSLSILADFDPQRLPFSVKNYLSLVPAIKIGEDGYARVSLNLPGIRTLLPVCPSQWSSEHSHSFDRLTAGTSWGIVLHWFGDLHEYHLNLEGFLRGFDGLRKVSEYITRTSAHFLVGEMQPSGSWSLQDRPGIVQIQKPDIDGTPFVASHLQPLDYPSVIERNQYFIKALDLLTEKEPGVYSILQDFFYGIHDDPNMRTIAVEISGVDFERKENFPSVQQVANVIAIVWALMKRYQIPINNLLGHCELDLTKADPGKKFMAFIRLMIGIKALVDNDPQMMDLVFGSFMDESYCIKDAAHRFFSFIRNYLLLTSSPAQIFEWESMTNYWYVIDWIDHKDSSNMASSFSWPVKGELIWPIHSFLEPVYHEGVDLYARDATRRVESTPIYLITDGICLTSGVSNGMCSGPVSIFQHRLPNGAKILSIYGNLAETGRIMQGDAIPIGTQIGRVRGSPQFPESYLHHALGFGSTWETDLRNRPDVPKDAEASWIRNRFFNPIAFLKSNVNKAIILKNAKILPR